MVKFIPDIQCVVSCKITTFHVCKIDKNLECLPRKFKKMNKNSQEHSVV